VVDVGDKPSTAKINSGKDSPMKSKDIILKVLIILLMIVGHPLLAHAADMVSFTTRNQSPLISIFGLPAAGDPNVMKPCVKRFDLGVDLANNYASDTAAGESIILDGESMRISLQGGRQRYHGQGYSPGVVSVRAQLKLPAGDSDQLQGSGSTIALGKKIPIDIGVSGDLVVATAPDAVFHPALRRTF
jgi:hypothetical protein